MTKTEEELAAEAAKAKADEEAKAKAEAEEKEEESEEESEDESDKKADHSKIDYGALLAEERTRREAAEKKLAEDEFKLREKKRKKDEDDDDEEPDDKPLTRRELQEVLAKDREATKKELLASTILEKARKLASSDAEANYIVELHKNRAFPANLSLDEQLEECYAIANRKVLLAKNEELKRALRSKDTKNDSAAGTHKDSLPGTEPKMASHDIQAIKDAGMVWDGTRRVYKKPLGDGKKHLYFDPKSKKRWVE